MSKGAQTRARLVESTARLLRRSGYTGTGVLDVIADSGAPRGSLYFHFPGGKEELAISALESTQQQLLDWINRTTLEQFFRQYARWIEKDGCQDGCPLAALAVESGTSPGLREAADQALTRLAGAFAAKLRDMGHDEADAEALGAMLVAVFEGGIIQSRARGNAIPLREAFQRVSPVLSTGF